ncbi:MAG: type 1 glutamine amidotransferase [Halioglobus sp.]|jgi:type 1 glutamine amidotransferase
MIKFFKIVVLLCLLLAALSLGALWYVGAWGIVFPSHQHDAEAPDVPASIAGGSSVLVFSKTNSFRHVEGIEAGVVALNEIAANRGWGAFHTENGAVFNAESLALFDVVVFLHPTGDMLSEAQEQEFETWLSQGGGWLGIHAAGDGSQNDWQWYRNNLIGADFTAHPMGPQFQLATVVTENYDHPVVAGVSNTWDHSDEWYSWELSPRVEGFNVLATLDESSYSPIQNFFGQSTDLHMGDHPVIWTNCIDRGRSVYIAMGHTAESYQKREFRTVIDNALGWLQAKSGGEEACNAGR